MNDEEVGAEETRRGEILDGVRVALFSRMLGEITHSVPDLIALLTTLVNESTPVPGFATKIESQIIETGIFGENSGRVRRV